MSRNLKGKKRMTRNCSIEGGRFLVNERPVNVPPTLVALVLLKDDEFPRDDYGYVRQGTADTILRIATFLSARKRLTVKPKGERA